MAKNKTNIKYIQNTQNALDLTWIMNNICTNSCRYCPPILWNGKNHHYEWEHAKTFLQRLIDTHKKIICSISGGEPTVSPFFPEVVKMMYDNGHYVQVTTNGARSFRYWEKIAPMIKHIAWSYHAAMMNETEEDEWIEKVVKCNNMTNCAIRVMMDSDHWNRCVNFIKKLEATASVKFEIVRILADQATTNNIGEMYTEEMEQWLINYSIAHIVWPPSDAVVQRDTLTRKITVHRTDGTIISDGNVDLNNIILTQNNTFTGWSCNIGLESLFVHFDGYVKKGNCLEGGNLFHINEHENYELPNTGEICTKKSCLCTTDVKISKSPMFDPETDFFQNNFNKKSSISWQSEYDKIRRQDNLSSIRREDTIIEARNII